jgi:hypothetical protein
VLIVQCEQWGCERESWEMMTVYRDRQLTVMSTNRGRNHGGKMNIVHGKKNNFPRSTNF